MTNVRATKFSLVIALIVCAVSVRLLNGRSVPHRSANSNVGDLSFCGEQLVSTATEFQEYLSLELQVASKTTEILVTRNSYAWPNAYHVGLREDQDWSVSNLTLGLEVHDYLSFVPGSKVRFNRNRPPVPNVEQGTLVGGHVIGFFDDRMLVRGLRGESLQSSARIIVRRGDNAETVERLLGAPTSAHEAWGRRFATEWIYECQTVTIEILFSKSAVESITVRDRDFSCGGPDC